MYKVCILFLALLLATVSCSEVVEYPKEPIISYESFSYLFNDDSTFTGNGLLTISYTDGDGDLGLDASDTISPFNIGDDYYYNLIIRYLVFNNGAFEEYPLLSWNAQTQSFDTISFNARFQRLLDSDLEKPISGQINYTIPIQNPLSEGDTIKLAVKIIDRALNESNEVLTDIIYSAPSFSNLNH